MPTTITVSTSIRATIENVWKSWITPEHIMEWNAASSDWYCPKAVNDFRVGGKFSYTMAARDGNASFDFEGTYTEIIKHKKIAYEIVDGRKVEIIFEKDAGWVRVTETFEAERENPIEMQRDGWQAILENFKQHTESL